MTSLSLYACGGGGSGGNTSPTAPPSTPGPLVASPNPLALQVTPGEANHTVTVTVTQQNPAGLITSSLLSSGCTPFVTTTQPLTTTQNISGGLLTATYASFVGQAVLAEGACTITFTPASGTPLVLPVVVTP